MKEIVINTAIEKKLGHNSARVISFLKTNGYTDGNFYKIGDTFYGEIGVSPFQFKQVKDICSVAGIIQSTRLGKPNRTSITLNTRVYDDIVQNS